MVWYLLFCKKKDMEETIEEIEFDTEEKWGGNAVLSNGETWWIQPGVKNFKRSL